MRSILHSWGSMATVLAPLMLSGCGSLALFRGGDDDMILSPHLTVPTSKQVAEEPSEVYRRIARQVHACWLEPEKPLLPEHQFFAEAEAGDKGGARITLSKIVKGMKRGPKTYAITMTPIATGTQITIEASRIGDVRQEAAMQRAVVAWAHGETACEYASTIADKILPQTDHPAGSEPKETASFAGPLPAEELPPLPVRRPYHKVARSEPQPAERKSAETEDGEITGKATETAARKTVANDQKKQLPFKLPNEHIFQQSTPGFEGR